MFFLDNMNKNRIVNEIDKFMKETVQNNLFELKDAVTEHRIKFGIDWYIRSLMQRGVPIKDFFINVFLSSDLIEVSFRWREEIEYTTISLYFNLQSYDIPTKESFKTKVNLPEELFYIEE